ncbi:dNTP triphosphohydrolase, partial [Mesorhizobium sp. M4A.F.Ca.ET.090.04.2.1]
AEMLLERQPTEATELGLDPEVVEAACLIHDLGHPPFGHLGEKTLNRLVEAADDKDGFEGNAQSFRVVTKLCVRFEEAPGLDLTAATLAAACKYPWLREKSNPNRSKKWGAYALDKRDFDFARESSGYGDEKTVEAAIMDWSDDIAYSVHDMEDLHRGRLIPWTFLKTNDGREFLVKAAADGWHNAPSDAEGRLRLAYARIFDEIAAPLAPHILTESYDGRIEHRQQLRFFTSQLIGRYINSTSLSARSGDGLVLDPEKVDEVILLKQMTRSYLILNPSLSAQQHGQKLIIESLFDDFMNDEKKSIVPVRFQHLFEQPDVGIPRAVADLISSLTESEATGLYQRLRGLSAGSVLDPIVR